MLKNNNYPPRNEDLFKIDPQTYQDIRKILNQNKIFK